jgi:hypothetical protein
MSSVTTLNATRSSTEAPAVPAGDRPSFLRRTGDVLTLAGALAAPSYGKGIGGINGIKYADIILGLAVLARVAQALIDGVPREGFRRQSVLLTLLTVFGLFGLLTATVNHQFLSWSFIRIMIATAGTAVLLAVYGDGTDVRPIVSAFALGTAVLALSSFTGPRIGGRSLGWSSHPNQLGHSCMIGVFAAAWLHDNAASPWMRRLWLAVAALDLVAINRSGSRGALLGLAAGGVLYIWLRGNARVRVGAVAAVWVVLLVIPTRIVVVPRGNPIGRLLTSSAPNTSAGASDRQRDTLLSASWRLVESHPIFGTGVKNIDLSQGTGGTFKGIDQVHLVYLQGWIAAGVLGGFALMLIGAILVVMPFGRAPRHVALACAGTAIATAWGFTNVLTLRDQWIMVAAIFATAPPLPSVLTRAIDVTGRRGA